MSFTWIGQSPPVYLYPVPDPYERVAPLNAARETQPVGGVRAGKEYLAGAAALERGGVAAVEQRRPALVARQIMSFPVVILRPASTVAEAKTLLRRRRFRHLPVVTDDGRLVGMVSERYLVDGIPDPLRPEELRPPPPDDRSVGEVMTTRVLTATPDTPIREAARVMTEERVGCLPILDRRLRPVGILTLSDVLDCVGKDEPLDLWT